MKSLSRILFKMNEMNAKLSLYLLPMAGLAVPAAARTDVASTPERPDIIFILADDMGYGDVSCLNPDSRIRTENIDAMARNGVIFSDAHSSSAVSTPSRYSVMTGRYNWRSWLPSKVLHGYSPNLIEPERSTMASILKECGYHTACVGKWHLGWNWGLKEGQERPLGHVDLDPSTIDFSRPVTEGPNDLGFDYFYGIAASLDMPPYVFIENRLAVNPSLEAAPGNRKPAFWRRGLQDRNFSQYRCLTDLSEKALQYIALQEGSDSPFFLYLPLPAPHTPIVPTEEFIGRSGIGPYGDYALMVDDIVGQIRQLLREQGRLDNTIIVFSTDNGCSPAADLPALNGAGHYPSYIFRGYKADLFEGGHRVPTIVEWSGADQGKVCDQTICLSDFVATFAALNGYRLRDDEAEDSFNLLPLLRDASCRKTVREAIVHHSVNGSFSIRKGDWKLLCTPDSGGWSWPRPGQDDEEIRNLPPVQLYNLKEDPEEQQNCSAGHPALVKRLVKLLDSYIRNGRSTPGRPQPNDREIPLMTDLSY